MTTTTTLDPTTMEDPSPDLPPPPAVPGRRRRAGRFPARPPRTDPRWVRPALIGLLVGTAVLYLWGLGSEGWANSFYAAAVQAGTKSWKAFFFGSFDSSSFITVDKPPASLWVMEISARIFGLNSWSILVPQALEGVATVGVLYATVKRWSGPVAGLLAGAVVALTPVAALMFRYNNPDALLVLLLTASAYATTRAVEAGRTRWLVLAMTLVGTGFITKMMQALLVVPAIGLVYLVAGPPKLGTRIRQLLIGAAVLVAASGWWVVIVELIPARDRPYIGGSQNNNLFNLIFGYNGFGRITGAETGSAANQWGATGWDRMFLPSFGSQISWLIPAALVLMAAMFWVTRHRGRSDANHYTWVAATVGSESAAGYQLATDDPVMAIGGFNGSDPTPTLAQFERDVADGKIHYFVAAGGTGGGGTGGGGIGGGSSSTSTGSAITSWVEAHFTARTVDGVTIYDLS